jgi:hypothetical protein
MKVAGSFAEARQIILDTALDVGGKYGIDIGKQFGTRIVMEIPQFVALKLLAELEQRDLPCPQVIYVNNRVLIGADPE